jgi:hypothetical protein
VQRSRRDRPETPLTRESHLVDSLGKCTGGKAITCDDSQPCTDDSCDLISGKCLHGFNNKPCEDNNLCTTGALCNAGGCGLPVFCDDGNPCTADSCSAGNCSHVAIASCCGTDAACDDGDGCTTDKCALTCDGTVYGGSCYKGLYANLTWTTAEQACVAWGGHLASIGSAGENDAVFGAAKGECGGFKAFIGLSESAVEGAFAWTDGSAFGYSNWQTGQPTNGTCGDGSDEDVGEMYFATKSSNEQWNDQCTNAVGACAVCEKPLPPGSCSHTVASACCNVDKDCDDGNACTVDSCVAGNPSTCKHTPGTGPTCCKPIVWESHFDDDSLNGGTSSTAGTNVKWQVWTGSGKAQSGNGVLYYGDPITQSYNSGAQNTGSWFFSAPLPSASKLTMTFKIYPAIEADAAYDTLSLKAQFNTIWTKAGMNFGAWNTIALDLTKFAGTSASFQLDFDTIDNQNNGTLGILIDDVVITRSCP